MNWAQISRIAWKDYRRIGGLWIAFVAFWGLCLGLIIWSSYQTNRHVAPFNIEQVILSVLVTSVIYAMAWAAITFAAEHEDKTYGFLRSLPLRPKEIFYGKLFFGVNSTILMIATLLLLFLGHHFLLKLNGGAYQWRPQTDGLSTFESLGSYLVACQIPLAMSVGLFWSLRLKRPLLSLVLTAVSVVSLVYLCSGICWLRR